MAIDLISDLLIRSSGFSIESEKGCTFPWVENGSAWHQTLYYDYTRSSHLVILSYADEHDNDPRATGTHGGRGVERYLLRSVADEVVRLAETPALTVRLADSDDFLNAPRINKQLLRSPRDIHTRGKITCQVACSSVYCCP